MQARAQQALFLTKDVVPVDMLRFANNHDSGGEPCILYQEDEGRPPEGERNSMAEDTSEKKSLDF
jgi:hypothetical protein